MASSAKNQSLKPFSENEGLFFILKDSHDNIKENAFAYQEIFHLSICILQSKNRHFTQMVILRKSFAL